MKIYKKKPLKLGKGGTPLVLTSSGKAWLVNKSKKAKACDGDVRACGPNAYLVQKLSDKKYQLLLWDSGSVKKLAIKFDKKVHPRT